MRLCWIDERIQRSSALCIGFGVSGRGMIAEGFRGCGLTCVSTVFSTSNRNPTYSCRVMDISTECVNDLITQHYVAVHSVLDIVLGNAVKCLPNRFVHFSCLKAD
jgi:hypothetical protein